MDTPTVRDKLSAKWSQKPDAVMKMVDYYCRRTAAFNVRDIDVENGYAWAVLQKAEIVFFDYKIGETIQRGPNGSYKATRKDTNLIKANSTNGAADMAIELFGFAPRGILVEQFNSTNLDTQFGCSDGDVTSALLGNTMLYDPSAVATPAQCQSVLMNTASSLFETLALAASVQVSFSGKRRDLAPMANVGQLGASSYARSWGEIGGDSGWQVEEGFLWAKDGDEDSDFSLIVTVEEELVVPLTLPERPTGVSGFQVAPERIYVEFEATVRGPHYNLLSHNQ